MLRTAMIAAALLVAAQLSAQTDPSTGTRVRVFAPTATDHRLVGRVAASTADSLMLTRSDGATVALSRPSIERLQVSRGHARVKWALIGAGAGLIVGGVLGGNAAADDDLSGLGAVAGFTAGVILGVPIGAITGAVLAPERWADARAGS